jgi:hypothetical protein
VQFRSVLLAAAIGAAILAGLWFAAWQWRGEPAQAAEWYDIARTVAFAFAALGVLPAGYIAYVRQRTQDWQLRENRREQDHREHVEATRIAELTAKIERDTADLQLANDRADQAAHRARYGEAAAQLGHGNAAIRLAGVYAMAQLADDWADLDARQQCIDVLCAYMRMPWPMLNAGTEPDPGEEQVRETVVRVITAHLRRDAARSWSGSTFDFTGAQFAGGQVTFGGAQFTGGQVTFILATFAGGQVTFGGAQFTGSQVDFGGAKFTGSQVTFAGAKFTGGTVTFGGARFTGSQVDFALAQITGGLVTFILATFAGGHVTFDGALDGGHVTFEWAEFTGGVVTRGGVEFRGWPPPDPIAG